MNELQKQISIVRKRVVQAARRDLDDAEQYYVYVLMDSTEPGKWRYKQPGGTVLEFSHKPFYVGKGKGRRKSAHLHRWQLKNKSHKNHTIKKIQRDGGEVLTRAGAFTDEATALAKEILLIETIGMALSGKGPLTNVTTGGEGHTVLQTSKKTKRRHANVTRNTWSSYTPEQRAARCEAIRQGRLNMSAESKKARAEKLKISLQEYNASMSQKKREALAARAREKALAQHAKETAEQKAARIKKRQATMNSKSQAELDESNRRRSESAKARYASLSPAEKRAFSKLRSEANKKAWQTSRRKS